MSKLKVKFSNGDVFLIPIEIIAESRTQYYSEVDGFSKGSTEWDAEMKQSLRHDEIKDWVENNMDWSDVKDFAVKEEAGSFDYDKNWFEGEFDVI